MLSSPKKVIKGETFSITYNPMREDGCLLFG